jgi:DNA modification methylase
MGCSDSIRSKGFGKVYLEGNDRRVHKPEGTLWVMGSHHIIFSLGFALQWLGFRIINQIAWQKPDSVPDTLNTAFIHAEGTRKLASDSTSPRS